MNERSACTHGVASRRSRAALGALSVALFAWAWAVPGTSTARAADDVKVRGRVLDPDGKPLAGAKLYLGGFARSVEAKYPSLATSGTDGKFEFGFTRSELGKADTDDSTYQVLAVAEGFACGWVTADSGVKELTVRLVKNAPVRGRILDSDGKAVAGAKLTVTGVAAKGGDAVEFGMGWVGLLLGQPAVLTTSADGSFKVSGVGQDRAVILRLEGSGIATAALRAHGEKFEHQAAVSRPIRGVVRDKDTGKPLAGATIFLLIGHSEFDRVGVPGFPRAVTDKDGRYELLGLAKAPGYSLAVLPGEGQLYFRRKVTLEDKPGLEPLTADVEMVQGLAVRGKVTDKATGQPVAGALVEYFPVYGNTNVEILRVAWDPRSEATTGSDGSYALTVLPGQGVIGVIGPKRDDYMQAFVSSKELKEFLKANLFYGDALLLWAAGANVYHAIPREQEWHALVLLEPGEKEKGLVRDVVLEKPLERKGEVVGPDGKPLSGVMVFGLSTHVGSETLKEAEFTVRGINPKAPRQLAFFHKEKNLGFYLKDLSGEKDGPLTLKLQACGSVSGRMVDVDGQPVAGMRVDSGVFSQSRSVVVPPQSVTTDKEGRFRFEGLLPGYNYSFWGLPAGVKFAQSGGVWFVVVEPGEKKDMGDLRAEKK